MDWERETSWYAIQTKPFREDSAAAHIKRLDLEVFLPKLKREQSVCGVWRTVIKALFPGYFFAAFCPLVSFHAVRYAPGVLRIVGTAQTPIPIETGVICAIRDRIQPDGFVQFETAALQPGDQVRIEEGPFAGWMGEVEREWDDGRRVLILLGALRPARMVIEKCCLQPVVCG